MTDDASHMPGEFAGERYPEEAAAFARIAVTDEMIEAGAAMAARAGVTLDDALIANISSSCPPPAAPATPSPR
jgi:hypothetical protein